MKAVRFSQQDGVHLVRDQPRPQPGPGEALIHIKLAAVCNTDLEIIKGYLGYSGTLGHEFVGQVVEIPPNDRISVGQTVTGEINGPCQKCDVCKAGGVRKRNHCPNRWTLGIVGKDGTFAEYVTLPIDNLFPVPAGVSDTQAVFAEPLAAAFRIQEQGLVSEQDHVAVMGDGKLGLLIAEALSFAHPKRLVVIGKHGRKLNLLPASIEKYRFSSVDETKREFTDAFDVVVEVTGTPAGLTLAATLTRPLGTIVLKSTCAAGNSFNTADFVIKELNIVGSRCGNFNMALAAMADGAIHAEKLIDRTYPVEDALEALRHAARPGSMKILISF